MQNLTTILDSKGGRILLTVDADTLDEIRMACEEMKKSGDYLDDFLKAIYAYNDYKNAQAVVAAYEHPARAEAVKEVFSGREAK
jgi:hypothetical protein